MKQKCRCLHKTKIFDWGAKRVNWGGGGHAPCPPGAGRDLRRGQVKLTASQRWLKFENKQRASSTVLEKTRSKRALTQSD